MAPRKEAAANIAEFAIADQRIEDRAGRAAAQHVDRAIDAFGVGRALWVEFGQFRHDLLDNQGQNSSSLFSVTCSRRWSIGLAVVFGDNHRLIIFTGDLNLVHFKGQAQPIEIGRGNARPFALGAAGAIVHNHFVGVGGALQGNLGADRQRMIFDPLAQARDIAPFVHHPARIPACPSGHRPG